MATIPQALQQQLQQLQNRMSQLENYATLQFGNNPNMQLQQNPGLSVSPTSQNPRPQCISYLTAATVVNNLAISVPFDTNEYDPQGMHNVSVNNSRFYAPVTGLYLAAIELTYAGSPSSSFAVNIDKNGDYIHTLAGSGAVPWAQSAFVSRICFLQAFDYIEFRTAQFSGSPQTILGAGVSGFTSTWGALVQLS